MTEPFNGSTALVNKIEHLLGDKKLSTAAAVRLILEKDLSDIKANHARDELLTTLIVRQDELERRSVGMWIYKNPRKAAFVFFVLYSFSISDIRQPIMQWVSEMIGIMFKVL